MREFTKLVFVWDNFGPMHVDRISACAKYFHGSMNVVGVEMFSKSSTYEWKVDDFGGFDKITLFENLDFNQVGFFRRFFRLFIRLFFIGKSKVVFCHYERAEVFLCALIMRFMLRDVYLMNVSKFDDVPRSRWRELAKSFFYLPYKAGITSGGRTSMYMSFLGIPQDKIFAPYNSLSLARVRLALSTFEDFDYLNRDFVVVSRFVKKKNLFTVLDAFSKYRFQLGGQRRLKMIGSGELELDLKNYASKLAVDKYIDWFGFLQSDEVAIHVAKSVALILISTEEQFGNVVIESMALGVPCLVSPEVGARDILIKSGVNGFVVESNNSLGLAFFMNILSSDYSTWRRMSIDACNAAEYFDSSNFAVGIAKMIGVEDPR
ncbi:glycosyltransferase [Curvibacter sp. HBC61]|uniref:Glycosyltransferase n=1 Tax=Curvibacter cyanobacteriorum TaxID=3026422 RepID=A0ABT5MW16_9BURK|nr:glycosyltransferase [Curvibacter sp. HBC61]MDD0838245.1 glycosyltransferase [Curvibacter sp. HBC61]